ncbi:MAG: hypothetical protein N4A45_07560 [Flavobacteriales bacterium]|jgi:long-subunit fatty acid transport protein|nr:hypothetical protein [Flavobacteriales bacterium]
MKKVLFILTIFLSQISLAQHDVLQVGAYLGVPLGDAGEVSKLGIGAEATYILNPENALGFGVTSGISYFSGKTMITKHDGLTYSSKLDNASYLPFLASVRYQLVKNLVIGVDAGYTLGLGKNIRNGFQYQPRISYQLSDVFRVNSFYSRLAVKGGTWQILGVGVAFSIQ